MARASKREKNFSHDIPREMADSLDMILKMEGRKHGIESRSELIRRVLSDLIGYYENDKFFKAKIASKSFLADKKGEDDRLIQYH